MSKKLYLHIGSPKTGTSTVQNFLFHQQDLLEKHGVTYFKNLCDKIEQHFELFRNFDENLERVQNELVECNYEIGIMSTELLVFLVNNNLYSELIRRFFEFCLFQDIEVEVIGVIREPFSYVISAYGEDVIGGRCPYNFRDWLLTSQGKGHMHVIKSFMKWENISDDVATRWYPFELDTTHENIVEIIVHKLLGNRVSKKEIANIIGKKIVRASYHGYIIEAVRRLNAETITHWDSYMGSENYHFIDKNRADFEDLTNSPQFISEQICSLKLDDFKMQINEMDLSYGSIRWVDGFSAINNINLEDYLTRTLSKLSYDENLVDQLCHKWRGKI